MRTPVFCAAMLACSTFLHAQSIVQQPISYMGNDIDRVGLEAMSRIADQVYYNKKTGEGVQGSPYLTTSFDPAIVILSNNKKYTNVYSRYDILHDVIEVSYEGKIYVLDVTRVSRYFPIDRSAGDTLDFIPTRMFETDDKRGLLQILEAGKKTLMKRTEVIVKQPHYVPQFNAGSNEASFVLQSKYYVLNEDNSLIELKPTKKNVIASLGSHSEEVEGYIKKLTGKISEEPNLRSIFQYFNTL